jgi:anti-anti-sigma factor
VAADDLSHVGARVSLSMRLRHDAQSPPIALVEVIGEIDLATSPRTRRYLIDAVDGPATDIIVDFHGVTFCDCTGLTALIVAHDRAQRGL